MSAVELLALAKHTPWSSNPHSIWLGSTLSIRRNLEKFAFPEKLLTERSQQIIAILSRLLLGSSQVPKGTLLQAASLAAWEKEFLEEHFLSLQSFHSMGHSEGFVIDETAQSVAIFNLHDHLTLYKIDIQHELEDKWEQLIKLEAELTKEVNFAFSPKFGFLTSDLRQCGTGLQVIIFLHLPALLYLGCLDEVCQKYHDQGVIRTGIQGDPEKFIGDLVAFRNAYTLGVNEEQILFSTRAWATKLIAEEEDVRKQLREGSPAAAVVTLKDLISRAYAVSLHSYQLDALEALEALSLIKLGVDLGWVNGLSHERLNQLLFSCRRGHLQCQEYQTMTSEEMPHKRALFIHTALRGAQLTI